MSVDVSEVNEVLRPEKEAAALLGISPSHLRAIRRKGLAPHYDFLGRYLYSEQHIEQFKRSRERRAQAA
jgi:DNA-binding transcriptional MerR regulator